MAFEAKKIFFVFCFIQILFINIFSGTTGKIYGRIIDSQTLEGLPGVNVMISDTKAGAVTDNDGYYFIMNIPSGYHQVKAYMLAYREEHIDSIYVGADMSVKVNFKMIIQSFEMDSVYVEANEIVRKDVTQQEKTISKELLNKDVSTDFLAVIKKLPGVVEDNEGEIHIRGGREDEVAYMVDGMSIVEPIFRTQPFTLSKMFVNEVKLITGGFNAEYGEAMSGIVNILTKEGTNKTSFHIIYEGNSILPLEMNNGDNHLSAEIGGPLLGDYLKYFFSGEIMTSEYYTPKYHSRPSFFYVNGIDGYAFKFTEYEYTARKDSSGAFVWDSAVANDYAWTDDSVPYFTYGQDTTVITDTIFGFADTLIKDKAVLDTVVANPYNQDFYDSLAQIYPHNRHSHFNTQTKFTFSPASFLKLNANVMYSKYSSEILKNSVKYNVDRGLNENSRSFHMSLTGNILATKSNLIMFSINRTSTKSTLTHGFPDTIFYVNEDKSTDTFIPQTTDYIEWYEFWRDYSTLDEEAYEKVPSPTEKFRNNNPWGMSPYSAEYAYPYYFGMYRKLYSVTDELKIDWQTVLNRFNEAKFGIDLKRYNMEMVTLRKPFSPYYTRDEFTVAPLKFSMYAQDKLEFEQMVLNFGIRFDYFDANTPYYIDKYLPFDEPLYLVDTIIAGAETTFVKTPNIVPDTFYLDSFWPVKITDKKLSLSPRFGISYPMAPKTYLRFNYGHFYQTPQMSHLYSNLTTHPGNTANTVVFGYPNLDPEHLLSYEVEIESEYRKGIVLSFAAFYKDYFNLVSSRFVKVIGDHYLVYTNRDYANSKGLEFTASIMKPYFNFTGSYTLLYATGSSSSADEKFNNFSYFYDPETGAELASSALLKYLEYDQRHTLNLIMSFNTNNFSIPEYAKHFEITFLQNARSGLPISTFASFKYLISPDERNPWGFYTDFNMTKKFKMGSLNSSVGIKIVNLFDVQNELSAYAGDDADMVPTSGEYARDFIIGEPYYDCRRDINKDGILTTDEQMIVYNKAMADIGYNPYRYAQPRTTKISFELWF